MSEKNREKLVGPIIHCSPDLTRTFKEYQNSAEKKGVFVWKYSIKEKKNYIRN